MNKTIDDVNLSFNGISSVNPLKMANTSLRKLNLTGNPIPYYSFEKFLTLDNYRNLTYLIMNDIPFLGEASFLQAFLERSIYLENLEMINCEISKTTFINIAYGL